MAQESVNGLGREGNDLWHTRARLGWAGRLLGPLSSPVPTRRDP
jgi:hypothetical protein